MALERETVDALVARRRIREKSAIRRLEETEEKEKEENEDLKRKVIFCQLLSRRCASWLRTTPSWQWKR